MIRIEVTENLDPLDVNLMVSLQLRINSGMIPIQRIHMEEILTNIVGGTVDIDEEWTEIMYFIK